MSGSTAFFCPGIIELYSPGSRPFAPRFSPAAQRPFFFVALRAIFSPRTLHCRFFVAFTPQTLHSFPCCAGSRRFTPHAPSFPPVVVQPFFSWRVVYHFSPSAAWPFFFVALRAPDTPEFAPLHELVALCPPIFPRPSTIFPRPLLGRFFPRRKVLLAPCKSHPFPQSPPESTRDLQCPSELSSNPQKPSRALQSPPEPSRALQSPP